VLQRAVSSDGEQTTTARHGAREIAVTMLREARAKTPVYAAAGAPEYWIVDVPARAVEVLSGPGPAGYARSRILRGADELVARPAGRTTTVGELFAVAGLPAH